MATDATGETGSGQDIVSLQATYSDDKLFAAMNLNGSCCNEGSFLALGIYIQLLLLTLMQKTL